MANRLPRQFFSNCLSLEKEASALRLDSVGTDRSSRLRLNTYSSSVRPVRGFRAAICRILAPWGCGTRRLRNRHAGFPPTIHSRGRWLRDLGGSRSSDAGTCRRGGSSRAWPLSRKMGKWKGDPGRVGRHSRAPGCPLRKRSAFHRIRGAFSSGEETRWLRNRGAVGRCRRRHRAPVLLCGKASMASGVISKVSLSGWRFR